MASDTFWPSLSDYKASVQNPQNCFRNEDLRQGRVFTDRRGLPIGASGNSAVVYQFTSGTWTIAVRCFLQPVTTQQHHYNVLSQHLRGLQLPSLARFEYEQQGIHMRGQWYPIVTMEWVEGGPLHTFVERHLRHSPALLQLATQWRGLVRSLYANHVAHGDLQHDNVRITPQGQIRLVDYDAMFVPALYGERSPEIGHPNFQHPKRTPHDYNEALDNFSALVIYISLLAIAADPSLWQQFHTGENLLFSANDYKAPQQSAVFQRLKQSTNAEVQKLAVQVEQCCRGTLAQVPKLDEVSAEQNIQLSSVSCLLPLQFESLDFYFSTKDCETRFSTYFPQSLTQGIGFRLTCQNLLYTKEACTYHTYQLAWHCYKPDGSLMDGDPYNNLMTISSEDDRHDSYRTLGSDEPGHWEPGIYRVEILIDGVKFTEGSFGIIDSLSGWNSNLELDLLRFF